MFIYIINYKAKYYSKNSRMLYGYSVVSANTKHMCSAKDGGLAVGTFLNFEKDVEGC